MSVYKEARLVMDTMAVLHQRGYGRLKLYSYFKGGIGAWRYWYFASDQFFAEIPRPALDGSIPGWSFVHGTSPTDAADRLMEAYPDFLESALGSDPVYVSWFAELLTVYPDHILAMESPSEASVHKRSDGIVVSTPYVKSEREGQTKAMFREDEPY